MPPEYTLPLFRFPVPINIETFWLFHNKIRNRHKFFLIPYCHPISLIFVGYDSDSLVVGFRRNKLLPTAE